MILLIGSVGFLCYFFYDINSVLWHSKMLQKLFLAGSLCIAGITLYALCRNMTFLTAGKFKLAAGGVSAFLFLCLLVYTLFFALPFEETYISKSQKRKAYTQGVYGLCRHPGILWFAGLYLSLSVIASSPDFRLMAAVLTVWNVLYAAFQDIWTFPRTFSNYNDYKKKTPFLLPDSRSIRYCFQTCRRPNTTQ